MNLKNIKVELHKNHDEKGRFNGLTFIFNEINEDYIYNRSDGTIVQKFPKNLKLALDLKATVKLTGLFLETISTYLYALRSKRTDRDLHEVIKSSIDENYYYKVRVSSYFFREEERGRYKISIAVIKKGTDGFEDAEIVNINLTKRDLSMLVPVIKSNFVSENRLKSSFVFGANLNEDEEVINEKNISITKIENSIAIDNIWLHGQELLNLSYTVQDMLFKLNIEKKTQNLRSHYRQMAIVDNEGIFYLYLNKWDKNENDELSPTDNKIKIPISPISLAVLYLYVDIELLTKNEFEIENNYSQNPLYNVRKKIDYYINMKESSLGVNIEKKKDFFKIHLVGNVNDGYFSEINDLGMPTENFIKRFREDGTPEIIPVLDKFDIDLKGFTANLIKGLSMAYTGEFKQHRGVNNYKFFVLNQTNMGRFKYQFMILSDPENKANSVLIIDKINLKGGEEKIVARYRQPLFRRYLYQLIIILLLLSQKAEKYKYTFKMPQQDYLKYKYKSFKRVEIDKDKEFKFAIISEENELKIGIENFSQLISTINEKDKEFLKISSLFRILNGYWLPFVGNKIAIGQDGYLTTLFGEIDLERDENGSLFATHFYWGTNAHELHEQD